MLDLFYLRDRFGLSYFCEPNKISTMKQPCVDSSESNDVDMQPDRNRTVRVAVVPVPKPFAPAAKPKTPEELNVAIEAAGGF